MGPVRGRHVVRRSGSTTQRTERNLRDLGVVPKDIEGYWAYEHLFDEIRRKLRTGARDTWVGETPTRAEIEELLRRRADDDRRRLRAPRSPRCSTTTSSDQRLKDALFGQGVIAAYGGPEGRRHRVDQAHALPGRPRGPGPGVGLRQGRHGDGQLRDRRRRAGGGRRARLRRAGGGRSCPSEGVVLEDGTRIRARTVALQRRPQGRAAPARGPGRARRLPRAAWRTWKVRSPVVKFNAALNALPDWTAAPGRDVAGARDDRRHRRPRRRPARLRGLRARRARRRLRRGLPPDRLRPVARARRASHLLSVFGQYAPYDLAEGTWDSRREEVARQFIDLIDRFAPGFERPHRGLRGARPARHRGSASASPAATSSRARSRPDQMWEHRLTPRTPVPGPLLLRRRDAPGRQRHRPQRPQRRHGGARRPREPAAR